MEKIDYINEKITGLHKEIGLNGQFPLYGGELQRRVRHKELNYLPEYLEDIISVKRKPMYFDPFANPASNIIKNKWKDAFKKPSVDKLISKGLINKRREENLRVYNKHKREFYEKHMGKYVVIAKGKVQKIGEFDEVKNVAMDANHRFIFKVEQNKKVSGTLRWPIKRKK